MPMATDLKVGDKAILVQIPEWLVHDLPEEDRQDILACKGKTCTIEEIDQYGYMWLGFSQPDISIPDEHEQSKHCWFCVSPDCLQAVLKNGTA